jgi:hypothetical protein
MFWLVISAIKIKLVWCTQKKWNFFKEPFLKMKVVFPFETLVPANKSTWNYNTEGEPAHCTLHVAWTIILPLNYSKFILDIRNEFRNLSLSLRTVANLRIIVYCICDATTGRTIIVLDAVNSIDTGSGDGEIAFIPLKNVQTPSNRLCWK